MSRADPRAALIFAHQPRQPALLCSPRQEVEGQVTEQCSVSQLLEERQSQVLRYLQAKGVSKLGEFEEDDGLVFAAFEKQQLLTFGADGRKLDWEGEWRRWGRGATGAPSARLSLRFFGCVSWARGMGGQAHEKIRPAQRAPLRASSLLCRRLRASAGKRAQPQGWSNTVSGGGGSRSHQPPVKLLVVCTLMSAGGMPQPLPEKL